MYNMAIAMRADGLLLGPAPLSQLTLCKHVNLNAGRHKRLLLLMCGHLVCDADEALAGWKPAHTLEINVAPPLVGPLQSLLLLL